MAQEVQRSNPVDTNVQSAGVRLPADRRASTSDGMKTLAVLAMMLAGSPAPCQAQSLPPEVRAFIAERRTCEHFLGEVHEGDTPERAARQRFVSDSIDIFCAGTDKRLAALRRRFEGNDTVLRELKPFEEKIE